MSGASRLTTCRRDAPPGQRPAARSQTTARAVPQRRARRDAREALAAVAWGAGESVGHRTATVVGGSAV